MCKLLIEMNTVKILRVMVVGHSRLSGALNPLVWQQDSGYHEVQCHQQPQQGSPKDFCKSSKLGRLLRDLMN